MIPYRMKSALLTFQPGDVRVRKSLVGDKFGELELVRFGLAPHSWFRCPQGHENLMSIDCMRRRARKGEPPAPCPTCKAGKS
jgi:hypothetical protein